MIVAPLANLIISELHFHFGWIFVSLRIISNGWYTQGKFEKKCLNTLLSSFFFFMEGPCSVEVGAHLFLGNSRSMSRH